MRKKTEDKFDYTMYYAGYRYQVSEDLLKRGDYFYDFILHNLGGNPVQFCDTESLADFINKDYAKKEFKKRRSAKIIATNDPALNIMGIAGLIK